MATRAEARGGIGAADAALKRRSSTKGYGVKPVLEFPDAALEGPLLYKSHGCKGLRPDTTGPSGRATAPAPTSN